MANDDDVRAASTAFYGALSRMLNGDAAALADSWSRGATVTTMHPIGGRQVGWDAVRTSFEQVAQLASGGHVELHDQLLTVVGDIGYELGAERGHVQMAGQSIAIDHRVTNVYRREPAGWKLIHHHTDVAPSMVAVLDRLSRGVH